MSADTQLEAILNSVLKEVCMRGDFVHAEAFKPAGNTCMVHGGACYCANANAEDFHKASLNFHYPQYACIPGRVWKTMQTEWHEDASVLPHLLFVRSELARVTGLKACYAIPLTRQGHVVSVVVFYSRSKIPYDEQLENTVFSLANDILQEVCQRFGQSNLSFIKNGKPSSQRRARTGTSKVWESAKTSLEVAPDKRSEADVENIIKFSKRLPFFKYVSTTAREAICRSMQHMTLHDGESPIKGPSDTDFVWFIVVKGRCDMMMKTEEKGKHYPMRAFEEGDTFAHSYLKMLSGDSNAVEGNIRAREPNTSVVRVRVEEQYRGEFRSQTKPLLYEELAKYFDMSADQAADRLGLCMSAIKKICRRHGIIRWPHRKLLSANKSLALIDSKMMEYGQTPQSQAMLRMEAINVLILKLRVMLNPTYLVNSELVHVQPTSDQSPARAMNDGIFEIDGSLSPESDMEDDFDGRDASPEDRQAPKRSRKEDKGAGKGKKRKQDAFDGADAGAANGRNARTRSVEDGSQASLSAGWQENLPPMIHRDNGAPRQLVHDARVEQGEDKSKGVGGEGRKLLDQGLTLPAVGEESFSIEHLSNMVRASLEKVPAHVREKVLSSVMTGLQNGGSGTGNFHPAASYPLPAARAGVPVSSSALGFNVHQMQMHQAPSNNRSSAAMSDLAAQLHRSEHAGQVATHDSQAAHNANEGFDSESSDDEGGGDWPPQQIPAGLQHPGWGARDANRAIGSGIPQAMQGAGGGGIMAGQAGNAGGYGGGSMAGASASRQMDPFPSLQPFRGYANPAQLPPGQGLPHPMSFMRPPFSSIHGSGSHGGGLSASDGSFSSQFRAHSLDNRGILSVGSDRNLPGNDKGRAPVSLPLPTGVPSADGGPNGLGPQQAPGYVANIHLLCDLLGGPLGSTGAT